MKGSSRCQNLRRHEMLLPAMHPGTTIARLRYPLLLLLITGALSPLCATGNEFRFRHLTIRDGLSQSTVNCVVQDSAGLLWFGTQDGLNRFDGYTCTVFSLDGTDSTGLADDNIVEMLVDRTGTLWVGTYNGGLHRYDADRGIFRRVGLDAGVATVSALCEDSRGRLWVGLWGGGLMRAEPDSTAGGRHFFPYASGSGDSSGLADSRVADIFCDAGGNLWVATWSGVSFLRGAEGAAFTNIRKSAPSPGLTDPRAWTLAEDADGDIWIGTFGEGVIVYRPGVGIVRAFRRGTPPSGGLGADEIGALFRDSRGVMWVGTSGGGLQMFDAASSTFQTARTDPYDPESLSDNEIRCLYEDRGGILWVGTGGGGVSSYDPKRQQFSHLRGHPGSAAGLGHNNVRAVCEDPDGGLWVGTRGGGVDYRVRGTSGFVHYRHDPSNTASLSSDNVLSIAARSNGEIWVGTQAAGLNRLDRSRARFRRFLSGPERPGSIAQNTVMALLEDRDRVLWIGTGGGGLDRWDDRTQSFLHMRRTDTDTLTLGGNWIWSLFEDRTGRLWVGTWGRGLTCIDRQRTAFRRYYHREGDATSLPNNTVLCIAEDDAGRIWVGTEGGGLALCNPATGRFVTYTTRQGLPNNVIYGVVPGSDGRLWISTNRGIARFDPASGHVKAYSHADGLQGNEFNRGSYHKSTDGHIYFGGTEGLTLFLPVGIRENPHVPPVVITAFRVHERVFPLAGLPSSAGSVTLYHDQNAVSFEFAALDFTAPEKNQYAYMLEGLDNAWVPAGDRRYVTYPRLDGGTYVFRVRGSNNDGVWNMNGAVVRLTIVPPFWSTWWFRSLLVLLIGGTAIALYRFRLLQALKLERMRTRIASDLHDDIGSTLTKIAVQSEMIQSLRDPEAILPLARQIGAASREVITSLGDTVWSIDARHDTVGNLLDRMRDFATDVLEPRHIDVRFTHVGLSPQTPLSVDVRQNLYLIFKEAVSNVARHSDAHNVSIALQNGNGRFEMSIADDGSGLAQPLGGVGHGFSNMEMRAKRMGARLTARVAQGVTIVLSGPQL